MEPGSNAFQGANISPSFTIENHDTGSDNLPPDWFPFHSSHFQILVRNILVLAFVFFVFPIGEGRAYQGAPVHTPIRKSALSFFTGLPQFGRLGWSYQIDRSFSVGVGINALLLAIHPASNSGEFAQLFGAGSYVNGVGGSVSAAYWFTPRIEGGGFGRFLPNTFRIEAAYLAPNKRELICPDGYCRTSYYEFMGWYENIAEIGLHAVYGLGIGFWKIGRGPMRGGPAVMFGLVNNL